MDRAVVGGRLRGSITSVRGHIITFVIYLLFVDDTFVFYDAKASHLSYLN